MYPTLWEWMAELIHGVFSKSWIWQTIRQKQGKKAEDKKPPIECRRLLIDQLQAKNSMDLDPEVE